MFNIQVRKSKRERSGVSIRLPGEALSEDEEEVPDPPLPSSQQSAPKTMATTKKSNKKTLTNDQKSSNNGSSSSSSATAAASKSKTESNKRPSKSTNGGSSAKKSKRKASEDFTMKNSQKKQGAKISDGVGGGNAWTTEYLEQHEETTPRQRDLLKKSFDFLYQAQQVLSPKRFSGLVKSLVEFDNGVIEVSDR